MLGLSDDTVDTRSPAMPWEADHVLVEPGKRMSVCISDLLSVLAAFSVLMDEESLPFLQTS